MSTKRLIKDLVSRNLEVSEDLAREVARRDDALNFLRAIFENEEYWRIRRYGTFTMLGIALLLRNLGL
jgi:hypothetical protein